MKEFTLTGPKTQRTFEIEDDEMIEWNIIKISEYEARHGKSN